MSRLKPVHASAHGKPRTVEMILLSCVAAIVLAACNSSGGGGGSKGGGDDDGIKGPSDNGTWLYVSTPEYYFGTRDVGSESVHTVEIANRGADIYPISNISLIGRNAEEFATDFVGAFELGPAEAVNIDVRFTPITDGRKFADLAIDYDTIKLVDESVNRQEQDYYKARDLERSGRYRAASSTYKDYVKGNPVTSNKRRAAIKLPIIDEATMHEAGDDLALYLGAVDARDASEYGEARNRLQTLRTLYPESHLADDAWYLDGYMSLLDEHKPREALATLAELKKHFPETAYYDTLLYSEALAHIDLGEKELARNILLDLRYRHTGTDTFGVRLPKDNLTSRLWFERAESVLATL